MRSAELEISNETFVNPNIFTTKVNYVEDENGELKCTDTKCQDACRGDSGDKYQIYQNKIALLGKKFYVSTRWSIDVC